MSKLVLLAVVTTVAILIGVLIWAYVTVVGLMTAQLGISAWEAVAILIVAHAVFGPTVSGVKR